MATIQEVAAKHGLSVEQVAAITASAPGGTVKGYNLHSDDRIEQRRRELAAERATQDLSNDAIRALIHAAAKA